MEPIVIATCVTAAVIAFATWRAPRSAFLAQIKWNKHEARISLYKMLMSTRMMAPMPIEHIYALNRIDLEFTGKDFIKVRKAWERLLKHLNTVSYDNIPDKINENQRWHEKRRELFFELLLIMGQSLNYDLSITDIESGWYSPSSMFEAAKQKSDLMKEGLKLVEKLNKNLGP